MILRCALFLVTTAAIFGGATLEEAPTRSANTRCPGPADKGPCNRKLYKWAYDAGKRQCAMFLWGGCAGNDKNRFDTEMQCVRQCAERNITAVSTPSPVPEIGRDERLSFLETGYKTTFMFAQANSFIQIDGDVISTFQHRLCRQISFKFRTRLPHGLLVYHNVAVPTNSNLYKYSLYIIVQQGKLKVVHAYGEQSTALTVGQGLNRDEWHHVTVVVDVNHAQLIATVDGQMEETELTLLDKEFSYNVTANVTSVLLVGGLTPEERLHGVKYIIESFVGCIRDVVLSSGRSAAPSDLHAITPLIATRHENVEEGCTDKCRTLDNLCFKGSRCINHYSGLTCDCFGTHYEGEFCDIYTATILTLRGSSYVSYRVYDWKDRVHSAVMRFSMLFKTRFDNSALFYASGGETLIDHYLAASIFNNSVYIEIDLGGEKMRAVLGGTADFTQWNNLTIYHEDHCIRAILNEEEYTLNITGENYMMYIDPEIYIGGGPEMQKREGLMATNNFVGSLKYVFYNEISILYELNKLNPKVHYIGLVRPEFFEDDVQVIPITFPFASSHIWWPNTQTDYLSLVIDFKTSSNLSVIASCKSTTNLSWEVRVVNDEVRFELKDDNTNSTHLISVKKTIGIWHTLTLEYIAPKMSLTVDNKVRTAEVGYLKFAVGDKIRIGSGYALNTGVVGCMRDIKVNGESIEPRALMQTERVIGEVTMDDCRFIDPCKRPNTCEHGGKCSVKDDQLYCDCGDTGYKGKNCHFAVHRKTCEELALLGFTKPDVYLIDIDGNGRFPPANVRCEFQGGEESTKTIVDHNLPSQIDVRSPSEQDFSFTIKYREFTAEMLQELVSHSLNCSQSIRYDCLKAPLELHSNTWFISSANTTVDFIGEAKRGMCPCSINNQCENPDQWCNCDHVSDDENEKKWSSDSGTYSQTTSLGIVKMFFRQQNSLSKESMGRITLGPLECVETNTQKYVVTFTSSESYIEVPGWRKGDLAFSFRTTGEKVILLYQPPIRPNYPSFIVALTSDYQLTFNFTLNTGVSREIVIISQRKLNEGDWHKIWIDYNSHHVRFMINKESRMADLGPEQEFGPFEGSMFIGGAPDYHQHKTSISQGLIGCFRGLVVNEEILDIYSYMSVHLSEIIKDCVPSCVSNPCENGAVCREQWSKFECVCPNPWAYNGTHCEININRNAVTFTRPDTFFKRNYLGTDRSDDKDIFKRIFYERVIFNLRTYDQNALILYANDHENNFVHIYMLNGTDLVYLFNYGKDITNITVNCANLNSSESVQVAIVRNAENTTLHVNDEFKTIPFGVKLLDEYSHKPWNNPEKEILAPHRPPAPPTEYFQINIAGYDTETLRYVGGSSISESSPILSPSNATAEDVIRMPTTPRPGGPVGYVGCLRGLQIGGILVDLAAKIDATMDLGVMRHCDMKCDMQPCKHGGRCIEDFRASDHSCDCEHTSFYGKFCSDDRSVDFSSESILWREFALDGPVDEIKVQMAFSSNDKRWTHDSMMLLIHTENFNGYYFLVALTRNGHLLIEEEREEDAQLFACTVEKSFINGPRHSVYYRRRGNESELWVDREKVEMLPVTAQTYEKQAVSGEGMNTIQIGGHNTTDPRFKTYKGYSGCLSNIFIEINRQSIKFLDEFLDLTKAGFEKVVVIGSSVRRNAPCSLEFEAAHEIHIGATSTNTSQGSVKEWENRYAPVREIYAPIYETKTVVERDHSQTIVIVLASMFVIIIICCAYEVYRSDKAYRRRKEMLTDANLLWSKEHAAIIQEPTNTVDPAEALKSLQYGKSAVKLAVNGGVATNGNNKEIPEIELVSVTDMDNIQKSVDKRERVLKFSIETKEADDEQEIMLPLIDKTMPILEKLDILTPMLEEDEEDLEYEALLSNEEASEKDGDGIMKSLIDNQHKDDDNWESEDTDETAEPATNVSATAMTPGPLQLRTNKPSTPTAMQQLSESKSQPSVTVSVPRKTRRRRSTKRTNKNS